MNVLLTDSTESASKEILVFFPDFNINEWYMKDEIHFRQRQVTFDREKGVHVINC